jgi:hypothetical protein
MVPAPEGRHTMAHAFANLLTLVIFSTKEKPLPPLPGLPNTADVLAPHGSRRGLFSIGPSGPGKRKPELWSKDTSVWFPRQTW